MNSRRAYLFYFIAFTSLSLAWFRQTEADYMTEKYGALVTAVVYDRPDCSRGSSQVKVQYQTRVYRVFIARNACFQGRYRVGEDISLMFNKDYQHMKIPGDQEAIVLYWISIFFFLVPGYLLWYLIWGFNKKS